MLRSNCLQFRMRLNIGYENRHPERNVAVDLLGDLQAVDLEPGLFERIGQAFLRLAALGLAENAIDHGLVAGLETLGEHRLGGELAARIKVDAGISGTLRTEIRLKVRHRRIAHSHDDPLVDRALYEVTEGSTSRMAHDSDAAWLRRHSLLELVYHGLRRPSRELLLDVDPERFGSLRSARLASERGAVTGISTHLHVHHETFADRIRGSRTC